MQEINKRVEEKKAAKPHNKRTGFEGFRAQMQDGGYSDSFTAQIRKLRPDGSVLATNGVSVVEEKKVRFRIACIKVDGTLVSTERGLSQAITGSQYNAAVDKTNDVWLDIRQDDHTWKPFLIGRAHFSHMTAVYDYEECSTLVDNYKTVVREKAKHILKMLRDSENREDAIRQACRNFKPCNLEYQNDTLYTKNGKGELKPLYKRVVKTYVPVVYLQHNPDAQKLFRHHEEITTQCQKWLQKNHAKWFAVPNPKKEVSSKKRNKVIYTINDEIAFIAKQTIRWGDPVFTDTQDLQPVTLEVIEKIVGSTVVGQLDIVGTNWLKCKHQVLTLFTKLVLGAEFWDSCTSAMQSEFIKAQAASFRVEKPSDLFSPAKMGLGGNPPHKTWFLLIESFYKAVGVDISYTHYQELTIKVEVETVDEELQEVIEPVDTLLTHNSALNGQSVSPPDPIDLLSEELDSNGFFDDDNKENYRKRINDYIAWRSGQPEFRQKLLQAYGGCVITGCISEKALEAAHIEFYSKTQKNDPKNGLLLRADIHTLFDRHLIGIDPDTMTVCIAPSLLKDYGQFNGKRLRLEGKKLIPDKDALRDRYEEYKKRLDGYDEQTIANDLSVIK